MATAETHARAPRPALLTGTPQRRSEDFALLVGKARFTDDLAVDGQAYACVVRSPWAHARLAGIELGAARAAAGVLDVVSGAELGLESVRVSHVRSTVLGSADALLPEADMPLLAVDKVRYVGEPVAFVVAETRAQAHAAAELVAVDYEPLDAANAFDAALASDAPRVFEDQPGNLSFEWRRGDGVAIAAAFDAAAHVARIELVSQRVAVAFMEPRAALAEYDASSERYTLHAGSQGAHSLRSALAARLDVDPARVRVVTPATGGGFGARGVDYPEFALCMIAARRTGRPVKWTAERGESFLSDTQSRDHVLRGTLALDAEGRMTALDIEADWRHGGYLLPGSAWVMANFLPPVVTGAYRIPLAGVRLRGAFTNSAPSGAYRGIGRVEANYLIEQLVDAAAEACGVDRIELRRRNLIAPSDMPWRAATGCVMDSGDYAANLDAARRVIDAHGFARRRDAAAARGQLRGLGVAMYVENDGGAPEDHARVQALPDGSVCIFAGTQDFGMGHATTYAQIVADAVGVAFEQVRVVEGDTHLVSAGAGSHGSRSARIGGNACLRGAQALVAAGMDDAAEMLEASPGDLEFADGSYRIKGTDRAATLAEVAERRTQRGEVLHGEGSYRAEADSLSSGCQACELEIDPQTGVVRIVDFVAVHDAGRVINPLLATGQLHGGIAQGVGQALHEAVVLDAESGQPLTGSFMDYGIPRADDLPPLDRFRTDFNAVPERDNELGVRGVGEGGFTGAVPAVTSALADALRAAAAAPVDMPATPERIWRALRAGSAGGGQPASADYEAQRASSFDGAQRASSFDGARRASSR